MTASAAAHDPLPLVSVGLPTYNRPDLLAQALDSLLKQTYPNIEIIISDNASPDPRVEQVAKEYCNRDHRIRYNKNSINIGAMKNFWLVLEQSTGPFFMWAADDDEWEPDFIEYGVKHIGNAGTIMGDMETVLHVSGNVIPSFMPKLDPSLPVGENAAAFFRNMQSSIFYGLHRTDAIRSCLVSNNFDFLDCLIVYKMLLRYGIKTYSGICYRAGVHSANYVVKKSDESQKNLRYMPFILAAIKETLAANTLTISQKLWLSIVIIRKTADLYSHHTGGAFVHLSKPYRAIRRMVGIVKTARRRIWAFLKGAVPQLSAKLSYSQSGEDMVVDFALKAMRIDNPTYLDIGANHPFLLSNTYHFYARGCRGVAVEPDPVLSRALMKARPGDIHLNVGVGANKAAKLPFFVMSNPTLNTFSEDEAKRYGESGHYRVEQVLNIDVMPVSDIFDAHFGGKAPDFISVDVEGLDFEIINSIDFDKYRPTVICVETIVFNEHGVGEKLTDIAELLLSKGYMSYADTHINTIFVDREKWTKEREV